MRRRAERMPTVYRTLMSSLFSVRALWTMDDEWLGAARALLPDSSQHGVYESYVAMLDVCDSLLRGVPDEALEMTRRVLPQGFLGAPHPTLITGVANLAMLSDDIDLASALVEEARAHMRDRMLPNRANCSLVDGVAAMTRGDPDTAARSAHEVIALGAPDELFFVVVSALELLAAVRAGDESGRALRLAAATHRLRASVDYRMIFPAIHARLTTMIEAARVEFGDGFGAIWAEGAAMTFDEAVAYAQRMYGERRRPNHGWESLTPAELDVVRLVAEGLTNPQIAERLFIETSTVKSHVHHIFTKLGVTTRAELAAAATRRA